MAKQRTTTESSASVRFVPAIRERRRKLARRRVETGRPAFQPAAFDVYWDYWFRGVALPLFLLALAAGMAIRGYAAIPVRTGGFFFFRLGWTVFHGLDARLLALSVVGIALWLHVRGIWTEHDRWADHDETGQTAGILIGVAGIVAMLLHQAYLIFR